MTPRGGARKGTATGASETSLRSAGSGHVVVEALWIIDPRRPKSRNGERESKSGLHMAAMFRPGMPVGERAEPEGRLEPSSFFAESPRQPAAPACGGSQRVSGSLPLLEAFAGARRFFQENLSLHARKLAKLCRQNSQR